MIAAFFHERNNKKIGTSQNIIYFSSLICGGLKEKWIKNISTSIWTAVTFIRASP